MVAGNWKMHGSRAANEALLGELGERVKPEWHVEVAVFPHYVYLSEAVRALEEGVASVTDIDNSMKLGCGHPMGPLTPLDFVGIDTTVYIADIMFNEFKEKRFAAPPLLKRMALAGWNGRKAGRGFYDYSDPANPKPQQLT